VTVGLADHARHKPFRLSGGQRQPVAIARALSPILLVWPRPTANLTRKPERRCWTMQRIHRQQRTSFLFSTHDPRIMERAGRIIRLRDGRVEAA
jgi:putative ABC transport system ATP-binding protein